jgi:nucleotide-binding universal stress UspA family protein
MKKILVPTDFSPCATAAAAIAMALAKKSNAELYFLNICRDPAAGGYAKVKPQERNEHVAHSKNELTRVVSRAEHLGIRATHVLVLERGEDKIENYIEPYNIDFIVMGSHGASGVKEALVGSNTQHIIRHVHVPVLVVKQENPDFHIKNILFASSFKHNENGVFREVVNFAKMVDARVHLVYINFIQDSVSAEVARATMNALTSSYPELKYSYNIADTNDEEWAINQFAGQLEADVIALSTYDTDGALKFITHPVAERLVNHQKLPVLVLNNK